MNILITGASGLIGGRLLGRLRRSDALRIRAASRTARAWAPGIDGCVTPPGDDKSRQNACSGMDVVVNLSSMGEREALVDPLGAIRANVEGAYSWISAAAACGVSRFIQMSTAKVYGTNLRGVVDETTPTNPHSHYAVTMRAAEDYATWLHPRSVVLRLANGFGAPDAAATHAWDTILNEFCRQAVTDKRIVIRTSGRTRRDFVPMDDVVSAIEVAIHRAEPGTYNVGVGRSRSLREAAEAVSAACETVLGFRPAIECGEDRDAASRVDALDFRIDRLRSQGFEPADLFEAEVLATVERAAEVFVADA